MKLKAFYDAYDLKEMEILKAYTKNGMLNLLINCDTHLDLIGNGIRPSFDVSFHHLFKFKYDGSLNIKKNISVSKYEYKDGLIYLTISGHDVVLDSDPEVIENYE